VRSREKMLEKLEVIRTYHGPKKLRLRFPEAPRSSLRIIELSNVSKVYDHMVFSGASLVIEREDRIGIVGRNGEGKSTLSRILAGLEDPTSGELQHGTNVALGYYSQEVDLELDSSLTVLEQVATVSPQSSERELRSYLGSFLFTGDDVAKKTCVLSGGEKSRLALARILISPLNFLILDEPTNHLDIFSRDVLEEALSSYRGTLVLISHDEKLLNSVVEKVYEVGGGTVREFNGTFAYYLEKRKRHLEELFEPEPTKSLKAAESRQDQRERKRTEAAERNRNYRERRKVEKRLERIEDKILPLEERKSGLEEQLADPQVITDSARLVGLQKEHSWICEQIAEWQKQWDGIAEELE
jgi:ATP-binding cassette subfamily F protein 3